MLTERITTLFVSIFYFQKCQTWEFIFSLCQNKYRVKASLCCHKQSGPVIPPQPDCFYDCILHFFIDIYTCPTRGHRRSRPVQGGPPRTIGHTAKNSTDFSSNLV